MPICKVAVIASEEDLLIIGDSYWGAREDVLCDGFVNEVFQRWPVEGKGQGQEEQEWYFPHDIINLSVFYIFMSNKD